MHLRNADWVAAFATYLHLDTVSHGPAALDGEALIVWESDTEPGERVKQGHRQGDKRQQEDRKTEGEASAGHHTTSKTLIQPSSANSL